MVTRLTERSVLRSDRTETATRRRFLKSLAATAAATALLPEPRLEAATDPSPSFERTADSCILLWMAGGMAAPETFAPKRYHPFEIGTPVEKILSTFPAIDTAVDSIKICQGLERIAKVMDRATLIRSHVLPDLGHILHSRHQYHWHTGYVPPQTVAALTIEKRPFYVTKDGKGKSVESLFEGGLS